MRGNEKEEERRPRSGHCCQACLLFSLALLLSHFICYFFSSYPFSLSSFSLSSVFHVGYAQAALPMPLTSVKPAVCMNRCSSVLLHHCNDLSLGALSRCPLSLSFSVSSSSSRLPRPRHEMSLSFLFSMSLLPPASLLTCLL